jgi:hypothetical protein
MCNLHTYRYLKIHSGQNIVHKLTKNNNSPWFKPRLKEFSVKGARQMHCVNFILSASAFEYKMFTPYSIKPEPQLNMFDLLKTVYSVHTSAALSIRVGQRQTVYIQQQLSVLEQVSSQRAAASIRVGQRQTVNIQQQLSVLKQVSSQTAAASIRVGQRQTVCIQQQLSAAPFPLSRPWWHGLPHSAPKPPDPISPWTKYPKFKINHHFPPKLRPFTSRVGSQMGPARKQGLTPYFGRPFRQSHPYKPIAISCNRYMYSTYISKHNHNHVSWLCRNKYILILFDF